MSEPYRYPPKGPGWTCFHCGETFTTWGSAQDHFGATKFHDPGCQIKVGEERGLLIALRRAEADRDHWQERAEKAEMYEEMLNSTRTELDRYFGVSDPQTIWMRFDDEKFRASHAIKRLDEARVSFVETVKP